jgi:hypothetical protein
MGIHIPDKKQLIPILSVFLFFCVLLALGFAVYKDYGVSTDEPVDYTRGKLNFQVFRGQSYQVYLDGCKDIEISCDYPPLFSMALYRFAPTGDTQLIYQRRHLFGFLFYAFSVFIFYLIGQKIFKDWKMGLLGSLFLVISPRIFGHAFYNPKDLPFMDAYIIAIYTMLLFLEKKNIFTAVLHGIAMAMACAMRTPGVILIPITFFFYFLDLFLVKSSWKVYLKGLAYLIPSVIVAAGLLYWFYPFLYPDPIANYIKVFNFMKQHPWQLHHLYMGKDITDHIPWHYSIVWFSISSPFFYLLLFIAGSGLLIVRSLKSRLRQQFQAMRDFYLVAACGVLPILVVIVLKSVIYSDNRQMYFCYPALLLISLYGFKALVDRIRQKPLHWQALTAAILIIGLAYPVYYMARWHTHENVYFNFLAGPNLSVVSTRFTMDRWGLAGKDALEYILAHDPAPNIKIQATSGIVRSYLILPKQQRDRITLLKSKAQTYKYFITHDLFDSGDQRGGSIYYNVMVLDAPIMTVHILDDAK